MTGQTLVTGNEAAPKHEGVVRTRRFKLMFLCQTGHGGHERIENENNGYGTLLVHVRE